MTQCGKDECNIETKIRGKTEIKRTSEEIPYRQLRAEIELPKQLKRGENQ